jgi:hypothetical protein
MRVTRRDILPTQPKTASIAVETTHVVSGSRGGTSAPVTLAR